MDWIIGHALRRAFILESVLRKQKEAPVALKYCVPNVTSIEEPSLEGSTINFGCRLKLVKVNKP